MSDISPIIAKVQKLLALSKNNTSAEESANAARAANKLIDEYRLSEIDLEVQSEVVEPIEEDDGYIYESGKITGWKDLLISALVSHYGLSHWNDASWQTGRKVSRYRLVGRKSDISIAKYMFSWISSECSRLAGLYAKGQGRVYVSSYCSGFIVGVRDQLQASRKEVQKNASSAAIVKMDSRANEAKEFMYNLHSNLRPYKKSSSAQIDYSAYSNGRERGKLLHLGNHLGAGGVKLLGN